MAPPASGGGGKVVLTAAQTLALVRAAGFTVLEERMVDGCEYNVLPRRLERTVRTCLFFVARADGAVATGSRPKTEL